MKYCTTFAEVENYWGKNFRHYARLLALDGLAMLSTLQKEKYFAQPRIHFLYFHHIFEDEISNFEKLVATLSKSHTFISHSEAVHRLTTNQVDKPYISWSSDDGFKNNLDAAKILDTYNASCCFYVNPYSIGLTDYEKIKTFCAEQLIMPPVEFLTYDDLRDLIQRGHEIGAHTVKHEAVNEMSLVYFKEDLKNCKETLEEQCGPIKHFAYPYGQYANFSKAAFEAVFEAGYSSCSTAVRGCHQTFNESIAQNELFIRRDQVIAAWSLKHIEHFMVKSVQNCRKENNFIPANY